MGMKRKRLAYVKKFGKKFAGWLRWAKPAPAPEVKKPAPEVKKPAPEVKKPEPIAEPVVEKLQEEKE